MGDEQGPRLRPKRAQIVALYTVAPAGATVVCVDGLGPVSPRNFPPAPGWSPDGHRIKVPVDYERGPDKVWVYGALCVRDGQALTQTAPARNTAGYLELLRTLDRAYPQGDLYLIADNLASHRSGPILDWLAEHPRIHRAFIPVGAAWLNLIEGWWRIFRHKAFAGAASANAQDSAYVTQIATGQLNRHARPWIWGRPPHFTARSVAVLCTVYEEQRICAPVAAGVAHRHLPPAGRRATAFTRRPLLLCRLAGHTAPCAGVTEP